MDLDIIYIMITWILTCFPSWLHTLTCLCFSWAGTRQWTRVRYRQGPPELHGHTAVKVADGMVLYGGEAGSGLQADIWKYHFGEYGLI